MGLRSVSFAVGEFYHVYNRGTDKRDIYHDEADKQRFQKLLYISNSVESINLRNIQRKSQPYEYERGGQLVSIGAYCLMPNHFHLLLTPRVEDGIPVFMKKLGTAYAMYFNKRYDRSGTLFEGPFKAKHVPDDVYLKYLYAYIHLNPLKLWNKAPEAKNNQSALGFLQTYTGSSLADYTRRIRPEKVIIDPTPFPAYFKTAAEHLQELRQWLAFEEDHHVA